MSQHQANAWASRAQELAAFAQSAMLNRSDRHGRYRNSGPFTAFELSTEDIQKHFEGSITIGLHSTSADGDCQWLAIDIDNHDSDDTLGSSNFESALALVNRLTELGIGCCLEDSNGDGGFHIWILFSEPVPAEAIHRFGQWLTQGHDFELFPKQAKLSGKRLGNWLRLPGVHHSNDHVSRLWGDGEWLGPEASVDAFLGQARNEPSVLSVVPSDFGQEPVGSPEPLSLTIDYEKKAAPETIVDSAERVLRGTSWPDLLESEGWKRDGANSDGQSNWTRPGKKTGVSATLNHAGTDLFHIFTDASDVPPGAYGKFRFVMFSRGFDDSKQVEFARSLLPPEVVAENDRQWQEAQTADVHDVDVSYIFANDEDNAEGVLLQKAERLEPLTIDELRTLSRCEVVPESEGSQLHIPLPGEIFSNAPGVIGDYYRFLMEHALKKLPEMFLAAGIALLSVATGRRFQFPFGQWNTRSNLYFLGLVPSGGGKDFARKINAKVVRSIDRTIAKGMLGPEKFASDSAMLATLSDYPLQIWQIDEFSKFMKGINSKTSGHHVNAIAEVLLTVFTESDNPNWQTKAYADTSKLITIPNPHAVVYGTAVPFDTWDNLTTAQVKDGLVGRLLVFEDQYFKGDDEPQQRPELDEDGCVVIDKTALAVDPPDDLIEVLVHWQEHATKHDLTDVKILPDAWDRLTEHHNGINKRSATEPPMRSAVWARSGEKTSKLAMLAAMSRGSLIINLEDVEWAILLVNALSRRLVKRIMGSVSENQHEADMKKVLSIIESEGAMIQRDVTRRTQGLKKYERRPILEDLVESGQLKTIRVKRANGVGTWFGTSHRAILNSVLAT